MKNLLLFFSLLWGWADAKQTTTAQVMDNKIKSCLATLYQNQISHHRTSGKFTAYTANLGADRNQTCNGLYIYTNLANEREFKTTARFGKIAWTVDQRRAMVRVR